MKKLTTMALTAGMMIGLVAVAQASSLSLVSPTQIVGGNGRVIHIFRFNSKKQTEFYADASIIVGHLSGGVCHSMLDHPEVEDFLLYTNVDNNVVLKKQYPAGSRYDCAQVTFTVNDINTITEKPKHYVDSFILFSDMRTHEYTSTSPFKTVFNLD